MILGRLAYVGSCAARSLVQLNKLDVIATLSTTAELGDDDNVNTLDIRVSGRRRRLRERTAEKIFPSDEVSAVFGKDDARGLIDSPIEHQEPPR